MIDQKKLLYNFNKNGFSIISVLPNKKIEYLKKKILKKIFLISKKNKIFKKIKKLTDISDYHKISLKESEHKILMSSYNRFLKLSSGEVSMFNNRYLDSIFEYFYGNQAPIIKYPRKKFFKNNLIGFRIVRPGDKFVAGFHSESSYGIHCFTLWMPLTGTDYRYTLNIQPGSHLFRHRENSIIKNKQFSKAKLFKKSYIKKLGSFLRPNLKLGEGIFFHPDLIHGGSENLGQKTRVSLEVRFYRKEITNAEPQSREIRRKKINKFNNHSNF
jgi:hypothetical protein